MASDCHSELDLSDINCCTFRKFESGPERSSRTAQRRKKEKHEKYPPSKMKSSEILNSPPKLQLPFIEASRPIRSHRFGIQPVPPIDVIRY